MSLRPLPASPSSSSQHLKAASIPIIHRFRTGSSTSTSRTAGAASTANRAPGLLLRIRQMIAAFAGHEDKWAQITDRDGIARQAIYILHAYADRVPPVAGKS